MRGDNIRAVVIPNVKKDALRDVVIENVEPGSVVRDVWEKDDSRELDRLWREVEPLTTES